MSTDTIRYADGPRQTCPWGHVVYRAKIAPGIYHYRGSNDHGGIWLSPERMSEMPEWARDARNFCKANGTGPAGNWFEQDVDWVIPALAWPLEFRQFWNAGGSTTEQMNKLLADAAALLKGAHPLTWAKYDAALQADTPAFHFHCRIETTLRGRISVRGRDAAEAMAKALKALNEDGAQAFDGGADSESGDAVIFGIDLQPRPGMQVVTLVDECERAEMPNEGELRVLQRLADDELARVDAMLAGGAAC